VRNQVFFKTVNSRLQSTFLRKFDFSRLNSTFWKKVDFSRLNSIILKHLRALDEVKKKLRWLSTPIYGVIYPTEVFIYPIEVFIYPFRCKHPRESHARTFTKNKKIW